MAELPICPLGVHCTGTDYPVSNFSSEAEDGPAFIGLSWPGGGGGTPTSWDDPDFPGGNPVGGGGGGGIVPNPPGIGGGPVVAPPPVLGSQWSSEGCFAVCISSISQANADLCAAAQAELCTDPQVDTTDHNPDIVGDPPLPVPRYFNTAKQCQFDCGDGTFNVFTVPAGTFVASSQAIADQMALSYACNTVQSNKLCMDAIDEAVCVDVATDIPVSARLASRPPIIFSITGGSLPPGMTLFNDTPSTAVISGTPSVAGTFVFNLTAQDDVGQPVTKQCTIVVIGLQVSTLPDAQEGTAYSEQLVCSGGGSCSFSTDSTMPPGLTLATDGTISGTPTTAGSYTIVVEISDSAP